MAEFIFGSSECLENVTIDNIASYFTYPEVGIKVFETKYFKCCTLVNRYTVFKEYDDGFFLILGSCLYKDRPVNNEQIDEISERLIQSDFDIHKDLTGRYLILTCHNENAFVINSIFGTFPSYFDERQHFLCSSNQSILNKLNYFGLDKDAIKERILFYTNYSGAFCKDISEQPSCSIITYDSRKYKKSILSGLSGIFRKKLEINNVIDNLLHRMESLLSGYKEYSWGSQFSIALSGGRDSRFFLSLINKVIGSNEISCFTIGEPHDIECSLAKAYTENLGINHNILCPNTIKENELYKYIRYFEDFNFPFQYKVQLVEFLKNKKPTVINTSAPEPLLCHLNYFEGDGSTVNNFVKNRRSCIDVNDVISGSEIWESSLESSNEKWGELIKNLPRNDYLNKIFFEMVTIQRDWVYRTLRPYDIYGNAICIMEDAEVLSILSHLKKEDILNDQFYEKLINKKYSHINSVVPTTRDLTIPKLLADVKSLNISKIIKKLPYFIKPGSLNYLFGKNIDFYRAYINDNKDLLDEYFTTEYIETLQLKLKKGWGTNRFTNFIKKRCTKDYLRDYDIIFPVCIIALRKEWERK